MNTAVYFHLKRPNEDKPTSIIAKARINGKDFKYYLGKSIHPGLWDHELGKPVGSSADKNKKQKQKELIKTFRKQYASIDIELSTIRSIISKVETEIPIYINTKELGQEEIDFEDLKLFLNEKLGRKSKAKKQEHQLSSYVDQFIEDICSGKRKTNKELRYTKGTIKNYKDFKSQLGSYESYLGTTLSFNDITPLFYKDFVGYFQNRSFSINTIGRHIKHLKVIMRAAQDDGLHENQAFKKFKGLRTYVDAIYLTEEEIESIRLVDLSKKPNYDLARDIFLLCCYTSLRYSDASTLNPTVLKERNGKYFLELISKKTNNKVIIPINSKAMEILRKYNFSFPKSYGQKVNKYIKKVGELAGIDELIEVEKTIGDQKVIVTTPKHDEIKTHTGRRSALTNMYLAGIKPIDIMKISGQTTEREFMKYIKISKEETAKKLADHPYFK